MREFGLKADGMVPMAARSFFHRNCTRGADFTQAPKKQREIFADDWNRPRTHSKQRILAVRIKMGF